MVYSLSIENSEQGQDETFFYHNNLFGFKPIGSSYLERNVCVSPPPGHSCHTQCINQMFSTTLNSSQRKICRK